MLKRGATLVFTAFFFINMVSAVDLPSCSWLIGGDSNSDNVVDIADPVFLLNFLFQGGESPKCKED